MHAITTLRLVPGATLLCADMTQVHFAPRSFSAVVCLYALIHLPLDEQPGLITRIATWLQPGGWLLLTAGWREWTGREENWLGAGAPMLWSHGDDATYRAWLRAAGMEIVEEGVVPEGTGGHSVFWAHRL